MYNVRGAKHEQREREREGEEMGARQRGEYGWGGGGRQIGNTKETDEIGQGDIQILR